MSQQSVLFGVCRIAESVTQLLSQYGEVAMVRICSRGSTNKLPGWLSKAVDAINMTMAPGEFALVEYGSEDDCIECINRTKNPDNWWVPYSWSALYLWRLCLCCRWVQKTCYAAFKSRVHACYLDG